MMDDSYRYSVMKRVRYCAAAIFPAILLSGCAALVVGGAADEGGYHAASDKRSSEELTRDAGITSAVNKKLVHDDMVDALDIKVDTRRGVVTLRGSVANQAEATRAVELARSTRHVRQVVSRLSVAAN